MQISYDIIPEILLYSISFFLIYFFVYKKYIYSIVDPVFIYIFTLSFSSVLVIYTLKDKPFYMVHFFLCHLSLAFGFILVAKRVNLNSLHKEQSKQTLFDDYHILKIVLYVLFCLYLLANVVLFYTTGFALLSDDPTTAKVDNFSQGFGIILKINWGIGGFLTAGLLFLILSKVNKIEIIMLFIVVLFTSLEGSKSSLLRILITFILIIHQRSFTHRSGITNKLNRLIPIGVFALFLIFFIVLFKENSDSEQTIFAFIRRLLYGADSTLYYYTPVNEQYFNNISFWQYPSHLFNQILGFLRLVPYQEALGNIMVANVLTSYTGIIVGPNTPYYIEGQIYFGYYGAFVYSLIVGGTYAYIRYYFLTNNFYSSFWLVLLCCICQQASALMVEVTLFFTQAFDTCFFVLPVYVLISLSVSGKIKLRRPSFL